MAAINLDFKSYSKINLGLQVLDKRLDGFHNMKSIFVELNFYDILSFKPSKDFKLICNNNKVPLDSSNTIFKAYHLLNEKFNFKTHYHITLNKNIPLKSGLGGGSSNAACTIKALKNLLGLRVSSYLENEIALDIGSDVPFFLSGGLKLVKGRGDIIENIKNNNQLKNLKFLIVCPNFSISTKWAYGKLKKALNTTNKEHKFPTLNKRLNWKLFENDFEVVVKAAYPEIMDIKRTMYENGALYSSLSGTGSTVFGIFNEEQFILKTQNKLSHYKTHRASPI